MISVNGVGKTVAYLHRYDSTLLSFVAWDGIGGASVGGLGSTTVNVSSLSGKVTMEPFSTGWGANAGFHFDGSGNLNIAGSFSASTIVAVSSLAGKVTVSPYSTLWAGDAGFHFDVSGNLLTAGGAGGSSQVTISRVLDGADVPTFVGDSTNNAVRVNVVAGSAAGSTTVNVSSLGGVVSVQPTSTVWAVQLSQYSTTTNISSLAGRVLVDQNSTVWAVQMTQYSTTVNVSSLGGIVTIAGNSTVLQGTSPWIIAGNSTVSPLAGSTWATRPIQSSAADLNCQARVTDNVGNLVESSTRANGVANSTRRGLAVRSLMPDSTRGSGVAASSGDVTVISSAANTGVHVYAYSVQTNSTAAGGIAVRFLDGSTNPVWHLVLGVAGASTGAFPIVPNQMAVSPPAYLFRSAANNALVMNASASGVTYAVSAWRE